MPKQPHGAVHYRPAILLWFSERRCATCSMYLRPAQFPDPPQCSAVLPPIYGAGNCDLYVKARGQSNKAHG